MVQNADFGGLVLKDILPKRDKPWWRTRVLLELNGLLLCALLTQTASGFDSSMLNGMQSLPTWQAFFGKPQGSRLGAMTFGPTGGILISIVISSQLSERFGRRYPICGGSIIIVIGSILQAAAQNYGMFVAARFLVGFGLGIVSVSAPPLLSECAYPTHRGKLVSFYLVTWPLGSLMAAWITYGTFKMNSSWSWRIPSLLQGVFSIVQAVLSLFCPESPRWLIYQNRHREARDILVKYHGDGDENSELVRFELAEISATLEMEKIQKMSRWSEWFSSRGMKHRFFLAAWIPAMLQWSGNALTSYYLAIILRSIDITDAKTQLIINACLSVWGFLAACVAALLVDRAGRRRLFLAAEASMLVCYIIWTICSALNQESDFKNKGYAGAVLAMIFLFSACYHLCSPIAPTYIMEVVPFSLRSKAAMMYQLTGNLAGLYNSFANPVAMEAIEWRYYIVWCCMLALNLTLVYFFFPETRGRSLEEVAEVFDGPNVLAGANAMRHTGTARISEKSVHIEDATTTKTEEISVEQMEKV